MKRGYSKKRKTTRRKATFKSNIGRSISPKTYQFKRSVQEIVPLIANAPGTDWLNSSGGGIAKTFNFQLQDLNDNSDFTSLFKYYKINAVRVQMYFSNNVTAQDEPSRFPNSQLLVAPDRDWETLLEKYICTLTALIL